MLTKEEKKLMQKCLQGNAKAQEQLYRTYVQAMYNLVIRMLQSTADAEDVLQESFVKVFQKLHTFKGASTIGAWIKRITINTTLMHLRTKGKMNFIEWKEQDLAEETEEELTYDMRHIHQAIKQLPDGCRVIFNLYLLEGYQHQEIADLLNVSISTSKSQYRRAKFLLREKLSHQKI